MCIYVCKKQRWGEARRKGKSLGQVFQAEATKALRRKGVWGVGGMSEAGVAEVVAKWGRE